jgi:hypothetical protein
MAQSSQTAVISLLAYSNINYYKEITMKNKNYERVKYAEYNYMVDGNKQQLKQHKQ